MLLLTSGCLKNTEDSVHYWQNNSIEAKLYDIPVPLNAQLLQNTSSSMGIDESTIVSYEVSLDYSDVEIFYREEMERLGWWQTALFKGSETLINFEKPTKYCSISIRPFKKAFHVLIFMSQKSYT